jgi:two-component system, chemotaxis family, protein-glutamate methylesterase/glutaminase
MSTAAPARVVVADDSALMRGIVTRSLERAGVKVVGSARDGDEALALCKREQPDAMTLDLAMPGLDGIGVLRALRRRGGLGVPVVVVSAFSPAFGARAVDALAEGAFDLVAKPAVGDSIDAFVEALGTKVKLAASSRPRRWIAGGASLETLSAGIGAPPGPCERPASNKLTRAVVIATSTGGPRALAALLPGLPSPLGLGTLIVQHMPAGFTGSLAARLNGGSALNIREAVPGELLHPASALIAPGGWHLRLSAEGRTELSQDPAVGGLRPRADLLIEDVARVYGEHVLLVVLTGMGNDGLRGAAEVRRRGGRILAEAQDSCTVYGMPRAIVDEGLADDVLSLDRIGGAIVAEAGG